MCTNFHLILLSQTCLCQPDMPWTHKKILFSRYFCITGRRFESNWSILINDSKSYGKLRQNSVKYITQNIKKCPEIHFSVGDACSFPSFSSALHYFNSSHPFYALVSTLFCSLGCAVVLCQSSYYLLLSCGNESLYSPTSCHNAY